MPNFFLMRKIVCFYFLFVFALPSYQSLTRSELEWRADCHRVQAQRQEEPRLPVNRLFLPFLLKAQEKKPFCLGNILGEGGSKSYIC